MTVTVDVVDSGDIVASASGSVSLPTLVSSDLVVAVMVATSNGTVTVSIDGSAMPQYGASAQNGTGGARFRYYSKTGISGTHAVSYTTASTTVLTRLIVYVVHGLSVSSITADAMSTFTSTATGSGVDEAHAPISAGLGQVAISAGVINTGTGTFPSNPSPSSGWVTDITRWTASPRFGAAHYIPTGPESVQTAIRANVSTPVGVWTVVAGTEVTVPELTSTFVGWGNPIF